MYGKNLYRFLLLLQNRATACLTVCLSGWKVLTMTTENMSMRNMPRQSHFSPPWGGNLGFGMAALHHCTLSRYCNISFFVLLRPGLTVETLC